MPEARCAWITFLLTSSSYLPGVLVLAHSLRKHKSQYPLIVAVNPALPQATKDALVEFGLEIKEVKPLTPVGEVTTIAERFVDTWTKIRVFDFAEYEVDFSCIKAYGSSSCKHIASGSHRRGYDVVAEYG